MSQQAKPKAGKYVPPGRRKLLAQGVTASPASSAASSSGASRRWSSNNSSSGGGGGGGGGRYGNSRQSGGRWSNEPPPRRKPTMERNERVERMLFGARKTQETGINFEKYEDIPVEVSGAVDCPPPIDDFKSAGFHEVLASNVELCGYTSPTPVQKYAVPISADGRDIMACAQTGSGKTAAFVLPMVNRLLTSDLPPTSETNNRMVRRATRYLPLALILAPTRELATQIHEECGKFCYRTGLRTVVVYGGQDAREQFRHLERGVDILVATPGRLVDFIERGRISLQQIQFLVMDEADRMLDMGFEPQIRHIVNETDMTGREHRNTMMFSATFPKEIQLLAQDFMRDYAFLAVGRVGSTTDFITQEVEYTPEGSKRDALLRILEKCTGLTLIFVETKRGADALEEFLYHQGINATSIHGDRSQGERESALAMFKCGRCPVLVATDVAARGLDIPNVLHVINFDLPNNIDDYVHRIGRTGRCGNAGTTIGFVAEKNRGILRDLYDIMKENNQTLPPWFEAMVRDSGGGFSQRRGGRRGKKNFGGRDYRRDNRNSSSRGNGGFAASGYGSNARFQSSAPSSGGRGYNNNSKNNSSSSGRGSSYNDPVDAW